MKIAKQLKEENVCEYLLYMWQVEDTLRAYGLDGELMATDYVPRLGLPEDEARREAQWLNDLISMMHEEGCTQTGHLAINKATMAMLVDLHQRLLDSPKQPFYSAAYFKALPYIVELRAKTNEPVGELETCFQCLYGVMMLRLKKQEVSADTQTAVKDISHMLALLSDAYKKEKSGELEL